MTNNKTTGLLLLGGATIFLLPKLVGTSKDEKSNSQSGGSGSGLIFVPTGGFGANEVTAPLSSLPNVIINEAPLPSIGTNEAPSSSTTTKKDISASGLTFKQSGIDKIKDPQGKGLSGGYYDNSGNLVAVADPISRQSRLATKKEQLTNFPSYGSSQTSNNTQSKKENFKKWYNPTSWF